MNDSCQILLLATGVITLTKRGDSLSSKMKKKTCFDWSPKETPPQLQLQHLWSSAQELRSDGVDALVSSFDEKLESRDVRGLS